MGRRSRRKLPHVHILSNKYCDTLKPGDPATAPVGTWPFQFAGRSPDGVVMLAFNPDHAWGSERLTNRKAPYLQSVRFSPDHRGRDARRHARIGREPAH